MLEISGLRLISSVRRHCEYCGAAKRHDVSIGKRGDQAVRVFECLKCHIETVEEIVVVQTKDGKKSAA